MAHGLYLVPSACPKNLGKATFVQPDENAFRAVIGATANIATVSSIVGHSNPNITLGIYTHEIKEATLGIYTHEIKEATARGCDTISNLLKERMEKSAS